MHIPLGSLGLWGLALIFTYVESPVKHSYQSLEKARAKGKYFPFADSDILHPNKFMVEVIQLSSWKI